MTEDIKRAKTEKTDETIKVLVSLPKSSIEKLKEERYNYLGETSSKKIRTLIAIFLHQEQIEK